MLVKIFGEELNMGKVGRVTVLIVLTPLICACSGGAAFTPVFGPFEGDFIVNGDDIGNFSLTMQDDLVAGSGTLTHEGVTQPVSISGNRTGKSFSGTVRNVELGIGNIAGQFTDLNTCHGSFNYADNSQANLMEGSWIAEAAH
jgi:hypothetical protein